LKVVSKRDYGITILRRTKSQKRASHIRAEASNHTFFGFLLIEGQNSIYSSSIGS